jgi:hypothetical protein
LAASTTPNPERAETRQRSLVARVVAGSGGAPVGSGRPAFERAARSVSRLELLMAALVARLTFVAELPRRLPATAALVARLTFVAELPRRLVGKSRTCSGQREEDAEHEHRSLASHCGLPFSPLFDMSLSLSPNLLKVLEDEPLLVQYGAS